MTIIYRATGVLLATFLAVQSTTVPDSQRFIQKTPLFSAQALSPCGVWIHPLFHSAFKLHKEAGQARGLQPASVDATDPDAVFGERLVPGIDDPDRIFNAWMRHTAGYRTPKGSRLMIAGDNEHMDRIAAFFVGNLMLAYIQRRERDYGIGWASMVRNYGNTFKGQLTIWQTDPAFEHFPWDKVILMGGDNYIHGIAATANEPGPQGSAEKQFVPIFEALKSRGLHPENTHVVNGNFSTWEGIIAMLPSRLLQVFHVHSRILDYIQDYQNFVPNRVRAMALLRKSDPSNSVNLEAALAEISETKLDIMQMGFARGPDPEPYYKLVARGEKYPRLRFLTSRMAGNLASVHLWFNDKYVSWFGQRMHVTPLSPATVKENKKKYKQTKSFWFALTLGLGDVQWLARHNIVGADTPEKSTSLHMVLFGVLTVLVPATVLQKSGEKVLYVASQTTQVRDYNGAPIPLLRAA